MDTSNDDGIDEIPIVAQLEPAICNATPFNNRSSLYRLLDSERWAHVKTVNQLKTEVLRRENAERELEYLKKGCEQLQLSLQSSSKTILNLNEERFNLYQEVVRLRAELLKCQADQRNSFLDVNHGGDKNDLEHLRLDMTPAKDRQIQVLRKRLSRTNSECGDERTPMPTIPPLNVIVERGLGRKN